MACNLVLVPSFAALLGRLLGSLRQSCRQDPLTPKWVVVPTSTAANHLRLQLGQRAGETVFAGVRIVPLLSLIRRLTGMSRSIPGERWGPALDLLLFQLVEQFPLSSPLARLQRMPSGYRLLRPTFLDLADGGFGPEETEILEELADEPDLAPLERETLQLYVRWIRVLEERKLSWEPLQHQRIPEWIMQVDEQALMTSLACERGQTPEMSVYGFYDFTDVNAQVVAALGRRINLTLFYPFAKVGNAPHPAFYFGQPVLEDLKVRLGTALAAVQTETDLNLPTRFFLSTFPEGEIPDQPSFLTFQRASGIRAELISAAVRVRQWMDHSENPIRPEEIMVVAPDAEPYLDSIREIFSAFAISFLILDVPVRLTPENHPLRMLARIWEDRAPAEWVLAYLRDCPEVPAARNVDLNQFEFKVREMGLWGGTSWHSVLDLDPKNPNVEEKNLPHFTSEEKALVENILDFGGTKDSGGRERSFTPKEAANFLNRIRERWLPEPERLDRLVEALEFTQSLRPDLAIKESLLREILLQLVGDQIQSDPPDRRGVLFVPLMRARGLTSRAVVLLGLASGTLPSRIREDPLLSDASRRRLVRKARDVGHRLPIKSHVTDEMSMLFFLLNTSAEYVHWVIPESDDVGRSVAPTPWVQRYIQRWDRANGTQETWNRIPRGPVQQGEYLLKLDQDTGSFLPPDFLGFIQPDTTQMFSEEIPYSYLFSAAKLRAKELTWNGYIPSAALPAPELEEQRVQVTDLEVLAKCPYRFYVDRLVKWKPLMPLGFAEEMNPLDWGGLVHHFLERLIEPYRNQRVTLGEIAEEMLRDSAQKLNQAARELPGCFPRRLGILPRLFREAALVKLAATVKGYFKEVLKGTCSGDLPIELEFKKRVPFPALDQLQISGRIDRIDEKDGDLHIYDYKSGKSPNSKLEREVSLGYHIQPILYPWLFGEAKSNPPKAGFSFIFLGDSPPSEKPVDCHLVVEEFLKPLGEILRAGMYLPTPTETMKLLEVDGANPCQFCDYISLCRRFDEGANYRYFRFSRKQLSRRLETMRGSSREKVEK